MVVIGVLSSCETFATNSCRRCSDFSSESAMVLKALARSTISSPQLFGTSTRVSRRAAAEAAGGLRDLVERLHLLVRQERRRGHRQHEHDDRAVENSDELRCMKSVICDMSEEMIT